MRVSKLFGMLSGLSGTARFSNAKLSNPESVLEHTGGVGLTCYLLCAEMNEIYPGSIDFGDVLTRAMAHDVEELLVGDVPRVTKYSSARSREMFRVLERWAMENIAKELAVSSRRLITDHRDAKLGPAGMVVELSDVLAVIYKVHEEATMRGNRMMLSRATSCHQQLASIESKIKAEKELASPVKKFLLDVVRQANTIVKDARDSNGGDFSIEETKMGQST